MVNYAITIPEKHGKTEKASFLKWLGPSLVQSHIWQLQGSFQFHNCNVTPKETSSPNTRFQTLSHVFCADCTKVSSIKNKDEDMNADLREKNQNGMQTKSKTKEDSHKGEVQGIKADEPRPLSLAWGFAHQPKWPAPYFRMACKLRIHFTFF